MDFYADIRPENLERNAKEKGTIGKSYETKNLPGPLFIAVAFDLGKLDIADDLAVDRVPIRDA